MLWVLYRFWGSVNKAKIPALVELIFQQLHDSGRVSLQTPTRNGVKPLSCWPLSHPNISPPIGREVRAYWSQTHTPFHTREPKGFVILPYCALWYGLPLPQIYPLLGRGLGKTEGYLLFPPLLDRRAK